MSHLRRIRYLALIMLPLAGSSACTRGPSSPEVASQPEKQELIVSGNVLILEEPVRATSVALADVRRCLVAKKYSDALVALDRAERSNNRVLDYHVPLLGVRSDLAHGRYVFRDENTEPAKAQLQKAIKLISEHEGKNEPIAREQLQDVRHQIEGVVAEMEKDPKESRNTLKRLTSLADELARKHP